MAMGLIHTEITLRNPRYPELRPIVTKALVDTGAITLCVPEHISLQLKLEEVEKREVTLADGSRQSVSYAGPLQVFFDNRSSFCGAMVMGDTVLLGAIAMEDMDLVISPKSQKIEVNPDSPNIPSAVAMGVRKPRFRASALDEKAPPA
jgi:clan AA aspartic protease